MDKSDFEKEDYLQNYIHENPESIPVYEIQEDKRLFVMAREFLTESGPIDALAVDKDGDIYIVETKLYKNPDKRTVVAQALDYGASMWKHMNDFDEFIHTLDDEVQNKFKMSLKNKLNDFFNLDGEQSKFVLDAMRMNLREGKIKFVILMDSMDERLKDLIIYVNQNSQFDIYAVQMEYYKFQDYEIMIPKMFGVEVKKSIKGVGIGKRMRWNEEGFMAELQKMSQDNRKKILALLDFAKKENCLFGWGTGQTPVFHFKVDKPDGNGTTTVFSVWSDGSIDVGFWLFEHEINKERPEDVKKFFQLISEIDNLPKLKNGQKGIVSKLDVFETGDLNKLTRASLWLKKEFKIRNK